MVVVRNSRSQVGTGARLKTVFDRCELALSIPLMVLMGSAKKERPE
jgi:hypothetical protein